MRRRSPRGPLRKLVAVLAQPPRVTLDWPDDGPPWRGARRGCMALMLMCARSVTGMRGAIRLRTAAAAALPAAVTVEAEAFSSRRSTCWTCWRAADAKGLRRRASVEFVLARETAASLSVGLRVERGAGQVVAIAAVPVA